MRSSISNIVVGVILLALGFSLGARDRPPQIVTVRDTLTPVLYQQRIDRLTIEVEGLRAKLSGVNELRPQYIYVADTVVAPPDTVIRFVNVSDRGVLSVEYLTRADSLLTPELHSGLDVSRCDDGWQIKDGTVLCDRARFGHLWAGVNLGTETFAGLWWSPSYRSGWTAYGGYADGGRWVFGMARQWQLF